MTNTGSPAPRDTFALIDGQRVKHMNSEKTYGDIWMVAAPAPVLFHFEGSAWRLDQVMRTDTGIVWVTFLRQTKAGKDFTRGGYLTITLEPSGAYEYTSVRQEKAELADALQARLAVATVAR
jgi:hypothetical protein